MIGGPISDIFGRRPSLLVFQTLSMLGWALVSIASFFGPTEAVIALFAGRFLHGLADSLGVSPALMFAAGQYLFRGGGKRPSSFT